MTNITAIQFAAYGGPEVLDARRIAAPQPAVGEVVIDVHAASMNPVDWKVRAGLMAKYFPVTFPMTSGRDGAGVISAVGEGVDARRIGERVCFLVSRGVGSWAEQIALPAALAVAITDTLSFTEAAALPLGGLSAWAALVTEAQVSAGMRVLIHAAAGGVGSIAVQIARDHGAQVIGTCSQRNVDFVRALGAEEAIAYDSEAFEDKLSGLDVVIDTVGGDVHRRCYKVLRKGGVIACLSAEPYEDRGAEYGVRVAMTKVMPDAAALAQLVALAAAGRIKPMVERIVPLADFALVHAESERGHTRGKTVLTIR